MNFSFGTLASTIAGVLAVVMGLMQQVLGCHAGAVDFSAVCTASWLPTNIMGYAAIGFGVIAFVAKLVAPGGFTANAAGAKAVILNENHPKSGPGTVTPAQVASP